MYTNGNRYNFSNQEEGASVKTDFTREEAAKLGVKIGRPFKRGKESGDLPDARVVKVTTPVYEDLIVPVHNKTDGVPRHIQNVVISEGGALEPHRINIFF